MSKSVTGSGEDDARVIVEAARKRRCDLIVVASEGRNALLRLLTGSVIPGVITASPVPVMVCKAPARAKVGAEVAVMPLKANPVGFGSEHPPANASVVRTIRGDWRDGEWMGSRSARNSANIC